MKRKIIYALFSVIIIAITIVASGYMINSKPNPEREKNMQQSMYVKTQKVQLKENEANMSYRGRVTSYDQISLATEVQGKILKGNVRFKAGEQFKKNDVLLRIYSEDVEASLKSGKSSFLMTISKILPDLRIDFAGEYEKWNEFFEAIDVEKRMPGLPEIKSNKEKVFLAANNVLTSYYNLQQQELNLKRYTIRAPFYGSFKTVNKEIGAISSPGAELASIIRLDKFEIIVPVFPSDLKWINKGNKVSLIDDEGKKHVATVSRIASFVDESTQSVNVYLTHSVSKGTSFVQGEYLDVIFKSEKVEGFEIPREALVDQGSVYELKDNKLVKVEVELLRNLEDSYIIQGVNKEQEIVVESLASVDNSLKYLAR